MQQPQEATDVLELVLSVEGYTNNMARDGFTFTDEYKRLKLFAMLQPRHDYGLDWGLIRTTTNEMDFPRRATPFAERFT